MAVGIYVDLRDAGLRFVAAGEDGFTELAEEVLRLPSPLPRPAGDLTHAAVLRNESGKAVISWAISWRYESVSGEKWTRRSSNFGSSVQLELLRGWIPVPQDLGSCILPGSKRLVTPEGMFGNNLDVLPADALPRGGGIGSSSSGGRRGPEGDAVRMITTSLDLAIFEDGVCVGADPDGLVELVTESLEEQRELAGRVVRAIEEGASEGQVFEILLPHVRRTRVGPRPGDQRWFPPVFGPMAMNQLIHLERADQLEWFGRFARPGVLGLRRG